MIFFFYENEKKKQVYFMIKSDNYILWCDFIEFMDWICYMKIDGVF